MNHFIDPDDRFTRFMLLTCGLLTLSGAVACLVLSKALLAVACCIVSAWSIGTYLDTVWEKMARLQQRDQYTEEDKTS